MPESDWVGFHDRLGLVARSEKFLTRGQIATRLNISPQTVARLAESGDLPEVRVTERAPRIRVADLDAFLLAKSTAPDLVKGRAARGDHQ